MGDWISRPEGRMVDDALIQTVVAETRRIASLFKVGVDLEWVYNGKICFGCRCGRSHRKKN